MIFINTGNTSKALKIHYEYFYPFLKKRINSSQLKPPIKKFLTNNLKVILSGLPSELIKVQSDFYSRLSKKERQKQSSELRKIFRYDLFINKKSTYNAYSLANNLDITACCYCNRQYTITINSKNKDGQLTRPDFDHFFCQHSNPLLSLSFYNLIPSCKICNSTFKGKKPFDLDNYIHPYIDNIISEFSFDYFPLDLEAQSGFNNNFEITCNINPNSLLKSKIENTFELFKITKVYNGHKDIVQNLLKYKSMLNDDYLKILAEKTYKIELSPAELYNLAFNNYYDENDFYLKPFSKLTKDILLKEEMLNLIIR